VTAVLLVLLAVFAGCAAALTLVLVRQLRYVSRDATRREQMYMATIKDLVDRTMYLADRPWNPAPAEQRTPPAQPEQDLILMPDDSRLEDIPYVSPGLP
jgi:predicted PurR-regulated permease PerM